MSVLNNIKGVMLFLMKGGDPSVKKAFLKVYNAVDSDLSVESYVPSSDVDDALETLNEALITNDTPEVVDTEGEAPLVFTKTKMPQREAQEDTDGIG